MTDLYSISLELRAVAHVLHYADYIQGITDDADFLGSLIRVVSDYLYFVAEDSEKTFAAADEQDCLKSAKIKDLQISLDKLSAEVFQLRFGRDPEQEQEDE